MSFSGALARTMLKLDKNSPAILFGAGVVGVVGSTVLACKATLKLDEVLEEGADKLNTARTYEDREYTETDRVNDVKIIKIQTGVKIAKLYAPAVGLGIVSIAALTKSHNILNKRNAALMAAYKALDEGFRRYRERVVEKYGEEEDRHFRYGVQEVAILDEKGAKQSTWRVSDDVPSIYARFFDPTCTSWSKEPEYNRIFLNAQQNWANDILRARGHIFLNEVYGQLGLDHSKAGSVVGWILREGNENYVDFGIFDDDRQIIRDFVNGKEGSILLDFNVDGVIYDLINRDPEEERLSWQLSN